MENLLEDMAPLITHYFQKEKLGEMSSFMWGPNINCFVWILICHDDGGTISIRQKNKHKWNFNGKPCSWADEQVHNSTKQPNQISRYRGIYRYIRRIFWNFAWWLDTIIKQEWSVCSFQKSFLMRKWFVSKIVQLCILRSIR